MLVGGKYKFVSKKGEGTFSEVIKAQTSTNKFVAIKRMKNHFDSIEQVNNLREVQALKRLSPHPGIIKLLEVVFERSTGRLSLVFELMEMNIYELIRGRRHYLAEKKIKLYMYQLLKAMDHMHRNGIFHRDIKPENILLTDDKLKIADFGSCRGVKSKQPFTEYISTRWYRAPECLLTDGYYNYKMDMWGVGCVFFEVMSLFPLFPGTNELDQIQKIHNIVGTPPAELLAKLKRSVHMNFNFPPKEGTGIERLIPNAPHDCVELIKKLLAYNPDDRLSARQALRHPYFRELRDGEKRLKHGAPLYTSIKPNPDSHDDTKKQPEPAEKAKSTLPQLKQTINPTIYQHANNITNITNINTNIINNITTNNINIINPPAATSTTTHPASTHPAPLPSHAIIPTSFGVSGISQFGQVTHTSSMPPPRIPPVNSKSIGDLPSLHTKPTITSTTSTSTSTSTNISNINNNNITSNGNAGHVGVSVHVSASDLLHIPHGKKDPLKKLPVLKPKAQDIEFTADKQKDVSPHNPSNTHQSSTVPTVTASNAPLPSIKGTGWKK